MGVEAAAAFGGVPMNNLRFVALGCLLSSLPVAAEPGRSWKPAPTPLSTRWAKDVNPSNPLPEYPRPQMVRERWLNLNGLWEYGIVPKGKRPAAYQGRILVPFAVESSLSGVGKRVEPDQQLWYRRSFSVPRAWQGQRVLLHFGASDWETTVFVNGKEVGRHQGGFDPFSLDITGALRSGESPQELTVSVWDPTDAGQQPRGKQVRKPHGIWYTPVTGIWQTVWLEPVARNYIRSVNVEPDVDTSTLTVKAELESGSDTLVEAESPGFAASRDNGQLVLKAQQNVKLWSPDEPHLYPLTVTLKNRDGQVLDKITSYFGMRKIALGRDENGAVRLLLNGKPLFQYGPLDQGWWPDGLYTAPTEEALRFDLEVTKRLGFNMVRKHIKVEPARWYYLCDKLGLLVWQDMPSGGPEGPWGPHGEHDGTELNRAPEVMAQYRKEWRAIIQALRHHPSIVMWVPFNEGWGQSETVAITRWTEQLDPTRLVNPASGGNDFPVGHVRDLHRYPGPEAPPADATGRALVLGEFGGLGLPLPGHIWQTRNNWGYRTLTDQQQLTREYLNLLHRLRPLIGDTGLAAAIYTQTTDVEGEVNGFLTYDRAVLKMNEETVRTHTRPLYGRPQQFREVVGLNKTWRYTTTAPAEDWYKRTFDDSAWGSGEAGFGSKVVATPWTEKDIWIRRTFDIPGTLRSAHLRIHHDDEAEVYINGVLAARLLGYTMQPVVIPIFPEARATLRPGQNTIAIHCTRLEGGQYIDAGLVDLR
jgi:beta-galactosidase/beta-glucuronidase